MNTRHVVEVDQSVKIEDAGSTVLAFSNGISSALVIPGSVKRNSLEVLQDRGKKPGIATVLLFAACLYLLLEDHIPNLERVKIDLEYVGHEADIRAFLLRHFWNRQPDFQPWRIEFCRIGKKSPAHQKAEAVRKGKDPGYSRARLQDILILWNQK